MIHYDGGKSFIEENFLYKFFYKKTFFGKDGTHEYYG